MAQHSALLHPLMRVELSLGNLRDREETLADLDDLPRPWVADHDEVMELIERAELFGTGIGYVDAHLLASTLLTTKGRLWTREKRLGAVAERLKIRFNEAV